MAFIFSALQQAPGFSDRDAPQIQGAVFRSHSSSDISGPKELKARPRVLGRAAKPPLRHLTCLLKTLGRSGPLTAGLTAPALPFPEERVDEETREAAQISALLSQGPGERLALHILWLPVPTSTLTLMGSSLPFQCSQGQCMVRSWKECS